MKNLLMYYSFKKLFIITALTFVIVAISGLFWIKDTASGEFIITYIFLSAFVGLLLVSFFIFLAKQTKRIEKQVRNTEIELRAAIGINKLTKQLLSLGDWAITAHFLDRLVKKINTRKPGLVLECGSGTSTLVIASCLKNLGTGSLVSLDHLERYAKQTENLLELEGLAGWANVITAPLADFKLAAGEFEWYGFDLHTNIPGKIDMLVVDGPPGHNQPMARYPAVPVLREFLADDCLIMLDDGNRPDEKEIAQKWASILDADIEYNDDCKGYWLIRKGE